MVWPTLRSRMAEEQNLEDDDEIPQLVYYQLKFHRRRSPDSGRKCYQAEDK